jgi:predicted S18 family serine protease
MNLQTIINKIGEKLTVLSVLLLALSACVSAPVQEMSDARQAIRSAEEAGAVRYSPQHLQRAQELLERAQTSLQSGAYFDARRWALDAREEAIVAREKAITRNYEQE